MTGILTFFDCEAINTREANEPNGNGTPCADCGVPRTALNTSIVWSDVAKTRLTFHYAVCDACRSAKLCKKLRDDPAAKLVQMGSDAAARTRRTTYGGEALAASACTELLASLVAAQEGKCASCAASSTGCAHDDGSAQVLCLGCQRLFNDLDATANPSHLTPCLRSSQPLSSSRQRC